MAKRIEELDGLRAFAIIAIFLEHTLHFRMMWMGVDLFFVLSGFLITGILLDTPHQHLGIYLSAFYERRVRRLLPAYLLTLVLISLFYGLRWAHHWYMYIGMMNYLQVFPEGFPNQAVTPFWSLAVEEQFYLVWPLLIFFLPLKQLPKVLCAALLFIPVLRGIATPVLVQHGAQWAVYQGTIFRADTLAAGALLTFLWRAHREKVHAYGQYGLIATALVLSVMLLLGRYATGFRILDGTVRGNVVTFEVALIAMTGMVLWALSGNFTGILKHPLLRWLATISYMFYLVHRGVQDVIERYTSSTALIAIGTGAVSLLIAQLSGKFLEQPILHGGSRKQKKLESAATLRTENPAEN